MENIYHQIYNQIKISKNILLVTHDAPDGDVLASACLMIELMESLAKPHIAYCYDEPPRQFNFLPHVEKIISDKNFNFAEFDLIIALDCGGINRTKLADEISGRAKNQSVIDIDHHPKLDNYADLELGDPRAAATTEVLYNFLKANRIKINKNIANCVLTGILTDTANFLYPSTSQQTVEIASEMLVKGAKMPQIMENTWRNKSLNSMKLWGKAMSRLKINSEYNFGYSILTLEEIAESGADEEELEGIAGFISNLDNVKGIIFLREQPNGVVKGSLRTSRRDIDVSLLARQLNGGGHAKASGFKIEGRLEETRSGWKII
ncbi:MAG: bifunctional oligoribonuclease/PAP phosphatase NrnA [bacterium]|nr:bifunctional oligoribonuclease/PAP phosphatase NrnA [bacterium]